MQLSTHTLNQRVLTECNSQHTLSTNECYRNVTLNTHSQPMVKSWDIRCWHRDQTVKQKTKQDRYSVEMHRIVSVLHKCHATAPSLGPTRDESVTHLLVRQRGLHRAGQLPEDAERGGGGRGLPISSTTTPLASTISTQSGDADGRASTPIATRGATGALSREQEARPILARG